MGSPTTDSLGFSVPFLFVVFIFACFFSFEGIGLVPPPLFCTDFPPFFINSITYWKGDRGWERLLGANLVGMFQIFPDV